jgi:hypothetical protein
MASVVRMEHLPGKVMLRTIHHASDVTRPGAISNDGKIVVAVTCEEYGYDVDTDPLLLIPR